MSISRLSGSVSKTLIDAGFTFWGPCNCTTYAEDWKDKFTREWNIRITPSMKHYKLQRIGVTKSEGRVENLKQSLDVNFKPHAGKKST